MKAKIDLGADALFVIKKLHDAGFEAYAVGGAVRNSILKRPISDVDVTTSATPQTVLEIFKENKTFAPGLKHGTVCVKLQSGVVEITTYRTEGKYVNHRSPSSVSFTPSLEEDIKRRDFTVNALCYDGENIIDLVGGIEDCHNKIIRAIGDPYERFDEDALRILRALRFCSALSFGMDEHTKSAVFARKRLLNEISAERISAEFNKILCGEDCTNVLLNYSEIIAEVIPEIAPCIGFDQHSKYHKYDVYTHSAIVVGNTPPDLTLRLAAFFHDIGKPCCYFNENGEGHFKGHAKAGAEIAERALERLKYPAAVKKEVTALVRLHDYPIIPSGSEEKELFIRRRLAAFGERTLRNILSLQRADNCAKADIALGRLEYIDELTRILDNIVSQKPCLSLSDLSVRGDDITALGASGKTISETLRYLLDAVISETVPNERQALIEFARNYLKNKE